MAAKRKRNESTTPYKCVFRRDCSSKLIIKRVVYKWNEISCLNPFCLVSTM